MADDEADKTEPATPKRREDARRKGEVAQSREIQSVVILATVLIAVGSFFGASILASLVQVAQSAWLGIAEPPTSIADYQTVLLGHVAAPAFAMIPVLLLIVTSGTLSQVLQTGPMISGEALAPKSSRISPLKGMKRMFSGDRAFDLLKAILKVVAVSVVAWAVISTELDVILGLADVGLGPGLETLGILCRRLAIAILAVLALMAVADLVYQRYSFEKKMRMSKREVREEAKARDGDPMVRSRFRQMQRDLSRSRMITAVADADVVVTNPTHFAVALLYRQGEMAAPEVLAKGRGHVALRIREAAKAADVPIVENKPLARVLHQTAEVGKQVPENLFQAVAEVLAYVYRIDPRRAKSWGGLS